MKLAVIDACIFVEIDELMLIKEFFDLVLETHTSKEVINELNAGRKKKYEDYSIQGKLIIHTLTGDELIKIYTSYNERNLSGSNKTVLFLANKFSAPILSTCRLMRNNSRVQEIREHGTFWALDQMYKLGLIDKTTAIKKITALVNNKSIYQNNFQIVTDMKNKITGWG